MHGDFPWIASVVGSSEASTALCLMSQFVSNRCVSLAAHPGVIGMLTEYAVTTVGHQLDR